MNTAMKFYEKLVKLYKSYFEKLKKKSHFEF